MVSGRGRIGAWIALLSVLLISCTTGPSTRPPVVENENAPAAQHEESSETAPLPDLHEPAADAIGWSECDEPTRERLEDVDSPDFSCARINTTLDGDLTRPRPHRNSMQLLKAGDGPIPLAVVNDVDGEPGTTYAAHLAETLPDQLLETFSLIGIDRRGTGGSDAVRCIPDEERTSLLELNPATSLEELLSAARSAGQQCALDLENEQTLVDSWSTAGDLDELRETLGMTHLHAIGHGEGSQVLTMYADRYPDRAGRIVFDGLPDPSPDRPAVLTEIGETAEATLDDFAADCTDRECALEDGAREEVTALVEQLQDEPLRIDDDVLLTAPLAMRAVLTGLAQHDRWPALDKAIAAAREGDPDELWRFVEPMLHRNRDTPPRIDGSLATQCNDTTARLPADEIQDVARDLDADHPLFGPVLAQELAWCSPWPSEEAPESDADSETPPMVVISTGVDPVTPEKGTQQAAERIPHPVRISWQGTGHGGLHSPCVAENVESFLVAGDVPQDETLCPA